MKLCNFFYVSLFKKVFFYKVAIKDFLAQEESRAWYLQCPLMAAALPTAPRPYCCSHGFPRSQEPHLGYCGTGSWILCYSKWQNCSFLRFRSLFSTNNTDKNNAMLNQGHQQAGDWRAAAPEALFQSSCNIWQPFPCEGLCSVAKHQLCQF